MARSLRIVAYAVNGGGIGHLTRLVAISRWLRRYAAFLRSRAEIYMLTTSDADGILVTEKMAGFKLPSPAMAHESGINETMYTAMAKQWVWNSLSLIRPELLIVDTWPRGSFGELLSALDLCKRKAFIYRPVKDEISAALDFQAMLPLYDRIIVPEEEGVYPVNVLPEAADRLRYVGPVMSRERVEQHTRTEARDRLSIRGDRIAVYVSAGGGGDPTAEEHLLNVCSALADDDRLHLIVGAGPLYRGRVLSGDRITWFSNGGVSELMNGIDLAVCAAGYNTFSELMHAGVPTVFAPQFKIADDQAMRAERAVAAGAAIIIEEGMLGIHIEQAVNELCNPERRAKAAAAARAMVPQNCARKAAAELLSLHFPPDEIAAAEAAVNDDVLLAARECHLSYFAFVEMMRALDVRDHRPADDGVSPTELAELSTDLMRRFVERGIPSSIAIKMASAIAHKLPIATVPERAAAVRALLPELAAFQDWSAAGAFLRMLNAERQMNPSDFTRLIAEFLAKLRGRGEDLYRGVAHVSETMTAGSYPAGLATRFDA